MTLPGPGTWREETGDRSEVYDEVAFYPAGVDPETSLCRVSITVQGRVPTGMKGFKAYLRGLGASNITDDAEAPSGSMGVSAQLSMPTDPADTSEPFEQRVRSWVTTDRTALSVIVTTWEGGNVACDSEKILGSMTWDGVEPYPLPS